MATGTQDMALGQSAMSSRVEAIGREAARYGLVVVVGSIGFMEFTAYEAEAIRPFVAHSPLMSWVYGPSSVRGASRPVSASSRSPSRFSLLRPHHDLSIAMLESNGRLRPLMRQRPCARR
jgi:uncharacterized membrane protein YkgB